MKMCACLEYSLYDQLLLFIVTIIDVYGVLYCSCWIELTPSEDMFCSCWLRMSNYADVDLQKVPAVVGSESL